MQKLGARNAMYVKGVGEARAKTLAAELDIRTARDLLTFFPFRYVDRSRFYSISEFTPEMPYVQVKGRFVNATMEGEGSRKRLVATFREGRNLMEVVWFSKAKQIQQTLRTDVDYVLFGKPQPYRGSYSMAHPEMELYNPQKPPEGLRGVYNVTESMRKRGFTSRTFQQIFAKIEASGIYDTITETLPAEVIARYRLMPIGEALRNLHNPADTTALRRARERLKFEELLYVQLHILRYSRRRGERIKGITFPHIGKYFNDFYSRCLPFELTGAQKRVLREIRAEMKTGRQMNRLLQGDVGSGKTMVAFMSMLMAVDNGYQASLMAPTEILAGQHYETLSEWGRQLGLSVRLLTGSTRAAERREILNGLLEGSVHILIGTHALIEETVEFRSLGLAVIDEQHRFGVAQRAKMWRKNTLSPHVLVMTATPIPRTLAMTVYGDLDVSVIDELPPGRKPVRTLLRYDETRAEVDRLILRQLREGRQVYMVYPLINENEKLRLKSLDQGYEDTCARFPDYQVSCVHGRMKADVKDRQMARFVLGEARILVATTVIEVGVNVPNATVIVINNAERFGLSQLHQLRGRVGRGADMSYCILMTRRNIASDTRRRLEVMTETTDGFVIAEEDMKMRGPGDIEGTQQSGIAFNFKVADLARDGQILQLARVAANAILDANPRLTGITSAQGQPSHNQHGECARNETTVPRNEMRNEAVKVESLYDSLPIVLAPGSLSLIESEIRYRFDKSVDWSQIS